MNYVATSRPAAAARDLSTVTRPALWGGYNGAVSKISVQPKLTTPKAGRGTRSPCLPLPAIRLKHRQQRKADERAYRTLVVEVDHARGREHE